jgi:hypothetical protein
VKVAIKRIKGICAMILGLKTERPQKDTSSKYFHAKAAVVAAEDAGASYQEPSLATVGAKAQDVSILKVLLNLPVAFAGELGYKGHSSYVWHPCAMCGRERWTELRKGRPKHEICLSCARIILHKKKRLAAGAKANLGEIKNAGELGYKGHNSYVWHPCAMCGRERWTELRKGRPKHEICLSCARIILHKKKRQVTHMCSPHYWLVDSKDVGRCKHCGQVKDFGELRGKLTLRYCR